MGGLWRIQVSRFLYGAYDLLAEAASSLRASPTRSVLTSLGMVIGAAAFVAVSGVSATLSGQVSSLFDERLATIVTASTRDEGDWVTSNGLRATRRLEGVVSVGTVGAPVEVSATVRNSDREIPVAVRVVSPGALEVLEPRIIAGRTYLEAHDVLPIPVALVPAAVSRSLGISAIGQEIRVAGQPLHVIGIFYGTARRVDAAGDILVFPTADTAQNSRAEVVVETVPGFGPRIASQIALALRPGDPSSVMIATPLDPNEFRLAVESDVRSVGLVVSAVSAIVGALALGNASMAAVFARAPEIGLRRAIGMPRLAIGVQLVVETTLLSVGGAMAGTYLGMVGVVGWASYEGYAPVIEIGDMLVVLALSITAGVLAGLIPGIRSLSVHPTAALRS